jgi:hypothetical protein
MAAQREIITALENALEARRQRILVSRSEVNWVKWVSLMPPVHRAALDHASGAVAGATGAVGLALMRRKRLSAFVALARPMESYSC